MCGIVKLHKCLILYTTYRNELMSWIHEAGNWELVVRPTIVETIAWAEKQFGKPQTDGNKWVIFGKHQLLLISDKMVISLYWME